MEDFNRLLDEYKNQYLNFLSSGSAEAKAAYQRVMQGIEEALSTKREQVDSEKRAMKHFAGSYQKDNSDLKNTMETANGLSENAQQINDEYIESQKRFDEWTSSPAPKAELVDVSNGYSIMMRVGIFLLMLPILFYIGLYTPIFGQQSSSMFTPSMPSKPFFSPSAIHTR